MALIAVAAITSLAQSGRQQQNSQPKKDSTASQRQRQRRADVPNAKPAPPSDLPSTTTATRSATGKVVPSSSAVEDNDVIRINSNLVVVPASVVDTQGRAITDLNLSDFQLLVDGQPKPLSELSRSETPVRLALLFDNSGSLTETRGLQIQAAISFFRRVLRPIDQAAIFSVSTFPALEHPLTNDIEKLVRTVEGFGKPEGGTALFDAIAQAATYLKPHAGRKVILIVSDGVDTVSQLDFETTLSDVQAADCQIFVVQTGLSDNANLRQLAAERRMQEFSAQTGGSVYVAKRTGDLDLAFTQIAADLAQQYVLSYYPSDQRRDGHFCIIRLLVRTRSGLSVRARKGYFAPKA
jgi:VWFA-related protein